MDFKFLDYSAEFFGAGAVPPAREGKFVQMRSPSAEFIVLSPRGMSAYHANIVERFSLDYPEIKGAYNKKRDSFRVLTPGWEAAGGGFWRMDEAQKTLELGGASQAYGTFDRDGLVKRLESALPGFRVIVS